MFTDTQSQNFLRRAEVILRSTEQGLIFKYIIKKRSYWFFEPGVILWVAKRTLNI